MVVTASASSATAVPMVPSTGWILNSMQDMTRLTHMAVITAKVSHSRKLPTTPCSRDSRSREAKALRNSMNAPAVATSRLIMAYASPIFLILAKTAAVSNPSGSMIYAPKSIVLLSEPPDNVCSN